MIPFQPEQGFQHLGGADILVCLGWWGRHSCLPWAAGPRAFTERTSMSAQDRQECLPHQEMLLRTDKNVCPTRRCSSGQTRMSAPPGKAAQDRQECLPHQEMLLRTDKNVCPTRTGAAVRSDLAWMDRRYHSVMRLKSGCTFWPQIDPPAPDFPPLDRDIACDVLIVGSGITGALVAYHLAQSGVQCVMVDRRELVGGSTPASTGLLQYEIDTLLDDRGRKVGPE